MSTCDPGWLSVRMRIPVVQPAVAPLPLLILGNRLQQMHATEIRPQSRRHINLGIGQLPKQKVAQPHLARSAHHQIGIGQVPRIKMLADHFFVNVQMLDAAVLRRRLTMERNASTSSLRAL